jgi:hypothetical protein
MKKKASIRVVLLVLGFIFLVSPTAFAGDYDGLWWNPQLLPNTFVMVRQVGNLIVGVTFELGVDSPPTVLLGSFNNNTAQMSSYGDPFLNLNVTGTFQSTSDAIITVNSCSGDCGDTPVGIPLPVQKLF